MLDIIQNIDCLKGMKELPDNYIDLVLCDPPYGTTKNDWDKVIDFNNMWEQLLRVTKESAAICMFSQYPFTHDLIQSNKGMFKYNWIYTKQHPSGYLNAKKMPMKAHELLTVFYKKQPVYNPQMRQGVRKIVKANHKHKCKENSNYGKHTNYIDYDSDLRYPIDIVEFKFKPDEKIIHPQQKPVSSGIYFINTYSNKGSIVLDFTCGAGTNAEAAIETDRHYICFETHKPFYEYSIERAQKAKSKMKLFY